MSTSTIGTAKTPRSVLRSLASHFKYACVINVVCALLITFLVNGGSHFLENLLGSFCVGTIIYLLVDGIRLAIWGDNERPPWLPLTCIIVLSVPVAQVCGVWLFGQISGQAVSPLDSLVSPKRIGLLMFTFFAALSGMIFFGARERTARLEASAADERARRETIERQAVQAQMQLLQAQIEPHMLFNTLANLQGLIGIDPPRAQELLDHLILYLRATLSSSRAERTTLGQEFALMEAYLGLMAMRMGQRLSYSIDLPAPLRQLAIPPMLLQPLVENAIQHGLEPKIEGGHIDVHAASDGAMLRLTVRDSGLGLNHPQQSKAGTQVGLGNTRARLLALYGERATFTLHDGELNGAVATLTLPLSTSPT